MISTDKYQLYAKIEKKKEGSEPLERRAGRRLKPYI